MHKPIGLVRFIDYRFQEVRLKEDQEPNKSAYTVANALRDAETKALAALLTGIRFLLKWIMVPSVLVKFALTNLGILKAPEPVLVRMMEDARQNEREAKAKKVGMLQAVQKDDPKTPA